MSDFFFLQVLDRDGAPVAYGEDDPQRDQVLAEPGRVYEWSGLDLAVDGEPTDYLANNVGVRLCSQRLRRVIDAHRGPADELEWLDAQVVADDGAKHAYYVLRLPSHPHVLDHQRTIRSRGDFVVKPVLALGRVGSHTVFSFPGATTRLVVAAGMKSAIERAGCTGVDFGMVAAC